MLRLDGLQGLLEEVLAIRAAVGRRETAGMGSHG
jgi:hypothetical protein